MTFLTDEQLKRYSRNIALPEIGKAGQEALLDSSVLIIGVGGLGSVVLQYLTAAGIGHIGLIDSDRIELSNLQRQLIYTTNDIGKNKVKTAAIKARELNPDINIIEYDNYLDSQNCTDVINKFDVIADCSDNFTTRFIVNEQCHIQQKTLVSAAISNFEGQLYTFKPNYPCYKCFCPSDPGDSGLPKCSDGGILGSVAATIGAMQTTEIIKELLQNKNSLAGHILIYNALTTSLRKVALSFNSNCQTCGKGESYAQI